MNWEGAELCYYCNGESYEVALSDVQFAIIVKMLGLKTSEVGVSCYSDDTLKKFINMNGNPLRLREK